MEPLLLGDEARAQQYSHHCSSLAASAMNLFKALMAPRTDCRIHNESGSIMKLIPKSHIDGTHASSDVVREDLVREIQPNKFIDVDSRKYDLNGKNYNMQITIHLVACPDGVEVAAGGLVFFHYELKTKGEIHLTCGKGGKVMEVNEKSLSKESTMTMHQSKK